MIGTQFQGKDTVPGFYLPRQARDSERCRMYLTRLLLDPDLSPDSLLHDLSGDLTAYVRRPDENVLFMERDFWNSIRDIFTDPSADSGVIGDCARIFGFSPQLVKIMRAAPAERYQYLHEPAMLSFAIAAEDQEKIRDDLMIYLKDVNNTSVNELGTVDLNRVLFWTSFLATVSASRFSELNMLRNGLSPELNRTLAQMRDSDRLEFLVRRSVQLRLRCSEEVIANILYADSAEDRDAFRELKTLQIISGASEDMHRAIENRFAAVNGTFSK